MDHNTIIGYIMFGQISDRTDKTAFRRELMSRYPGKEMADMINKIKFKKSKQLLAASKILETCTSYILAKEMVTPSRLHLFNVIDDYISSHLDENLDVATLCSKFNISRTRLYAITQPYVDGKIAGYIKEKRLSRAKELLKSSKMTVAEIAGAVYNLGVGDPVDELIETTGKEAADRRFSCPGFPSGCHAVIFLALQPLIHFRQHGGRMLQVRIHNNDIIALGVLETGIHGGFLAEISGKGQVTNVRLFL